VGPKRQGKPRAGAQKDPRGRDPEGWGSLKQPLWKTIWGLLKKLNLDLPYDSAIPFLGINLKECESGYSKGTCTSMFIAALFTIAKL
jgi:hypothetical protein